MKALFLGTLTASQATPIIEFITADARQRRNHAVPQGAGEHLDASGLSKYDMPEFILPYRCA
jgi:hypothetical protein